MHINVQALGMVVFRSLDYFLTLLYINIENQVCQFSFKSKQPLFYVSLFLNMVAINMQVYIYNFLYGLCEVLTLIKMTFP